MDKFDDHMQNVYTWFIEWRNERYRLQKVADMLSGLMIHNALPCSESIII